MMVQTKQQVNPTGATGNLAKASTPTRDPAVGRSRPRRVTVGTLDKRASAAMNRASALGWDEV